VIEGARRHHREDAHHVAEHPAHLGPGVGPHDEDRRAGDQDDGADQVNPTAHERLHVVRVTGAQGRGRGALPGADVEWMLESPGSSGGTFTGFIVP